MRAMLLVLVAVSLMGMPYTTLLPVIARDVLGGGAGTLGALQAAAGIGALAGALYLASRRSVLGLERVIVAAAMAFGIGLIAFSRVHVAWLALPLNLLAGGAMILHWSAINTVLQTIVDEDKRGRVMSLFAMALFGSAPFGSLISGALAGRVGAQNTILVGGVAVLIAGGVFLHALPDFWRDVQAIYVRKGLAPAPEADAAAGLARPVES